MAKMAEYKVTFTKEALKGIKEISEYLMLQSGAQSVLKFRQQIADFESSMSHFPFRGNVRDEYLKGLRIIGLAKRVTIGFTVEGHQVIILWEIYTQGNGAIKVGFVFYDLKQ